MYISTLLIIVYKLGKNPHIYYDIKTIDQQVLNNDGRTGQG